MIHFWVSVVNVWVAACIVVAICSKRKIALRSILRWRTDLIHAGRQKKEQA